MLNITWRDFRERFLVLPAFEKHVLESNESISAVSVSTDGMHVAYGGLSNEVYLHHLLPGMRKYDAVVPLALDKKMVSTALRCLPFNFRLTYHGTITEGCFRCGAWEQQRRRMGFGECHELAFVSQF